MTTTNRQLTVSQWPASGLEAVSCCPVCSAGERRQLHADLADRLFSAPGFWSLYRCCRCKSAYLDPRPTPSTIGLAYRSYITHETVPPFSSLGPVEKLQTVFANGYRNHRYGTHDRPTSRWGVLAASLLPDQRAVVDAGMRHLTVKKERKRLLDIGFGNALFLKRAVAAGWDAIGVDPDPKTVQTANRQGLNVRCGNVEALDPAVERFDVITMAHVIEHVHHPLRVLTSCYRLLNRKGYLWIETPNVESTGHQLFGRFWRGLETPRHLTLFSFQALFDTLQAVGFTKVEPQSYRPLCAFMFNQSNAIAHHVDPYTAVDFQLPGKILRKAERIARKFPLSREFITVKAWK